MTTAKFPALRDAYLKAAREMLDDLATEVPVVQPPPIVQPPAPIVRTVFPPDNWWNRDISKDPVDPNSANIIAMTQPGNELHPDWGTTYQGVPWGIPVTRVKGTQPRVPVTFDYASDSDPGPYPIPPNALIQGGPNADGDRHVIILDEDNWKLYELFDAHPIDGGKSWHAGSGAIFDLSSNKLRPAGWTSADAAGLPIYPGLIQYEETVIKGVITHAMRFTVPTTRKAYVPPARHYTVDTDNNPNLPPMGARVRLKASVDISKFAPECKVILTALKKYGMFVCDNGPGWMFCGVPDPRWNDANINTLKLIHGSDFEVVKMEGVVSGS